MISIRDGCHSGTVHGKGTSIRTELRAFGSFFASSMQLQGSWVGSTFDPLSGLGFRGFRRDQDLRLTRPVQNLTADKASHGAQGLCRRPQENIGGIGLRVGRETAAAAAAASCP